MFDELLRELRRIEKPVSVPIDMPLDDKGYLDRKCPDEECGTSFKVLFDDWKQKVPDEFAVCPKCGEKSQPSDFNTPWQQKYIEDFAHAYMSRQLNNAVGRAARRARPQRLSAGLLNVEMSVSFKAGTFAMVLLPSAAETLRQDLTCDACSCRYSTIGAGYFCPACGHNSPLKDVEGTIEMARKAIEALPTLIETLGKLYDPDIAANFEQQLLEDQLENLVTAFQRGTESLFDRLSNPSASKRDANFFQRTNDASALWKSITGVGYEDILDPQDMDFLRIMVFRRHKIGHCQGIVDTKYVQQSGDGTYEVGQRLVSRPHHILRLATVLDSLIHGLKALVPSC